MVWSWVLRLCRIQQFQVHCFKQDPNYLATAPKNVITIEENGGLLDEERDQNAMLAASNLSMDLFDTSLPDVVNKFDDNMVYRKSPPDIQPSNVLAPRLSLDSAGTFNPYHDLSNQPVLTSTSFQAGATDIPILRKPVSCISLPSYIKPLEGLVAQEDIGYLQQKGALAIPEPELRNSLLQGFTEYVYPYMPVVDLQNFVDVISQGDGQNGQLSLLVFQAVMFAGSAFIDMKYLSRAGYVTRRVARRALFRKIRVRQTFV